MVYLKYASMAYYLYICWKIIYEHQYEYYTNPDSGFDFMVAQDVNNLNYFGYDLGFTQMKMGLYILSAYFIFVYCDSGHWIMNNYLAISFCVYIIEKWTQITSFWQICVVFVGLIIYDTYFVFSTDVMMTVAKGFDMPMKLLFPLGHSVGKKGFGMLGIGDIIIPGLLTSLCMRADFIRHLTIKVLKQRKK